MKKYFLKNEEGQLGPFSLDELKDKNINAGTPIRPEDAEEWTTAGQLEDLKALIIPPVAEKTAATAVVAVGTAAAASAAASPAPAPAATVAGGKSGQAGKPGKAWVTWALSLAVIAGAGYFVYQDMEKNKNSSSAIVIDDSTGVPTADTVANNDVTNTSDDPDSLHFMIVDSVTTESEPPMAVTTVTTTADQANAKEAEDKKKKAAELAKKKADEEKKRLLVASLKRNEDEKKRQLAAQAAFEKEKEMRNNWPRYVRVGSYEIKGDDQVKPFSIPVSNGFLVPIENVTLRVDYLKKEKLVGTEILTLSNISPRSTQNILAAGNKKGKRVNVYITGINSRQLHFCYPVNSGNPADPYYCK